MEQGSRLLEVTDKEGEPIDSEKIYKVAILEFMLQGKDGYKMLLEPEVKVIGRSDNAISL